MWIRPELLQWSAALIRQTPSVTEPAWVSRTIQANPATDVQAAHRHVT